MALQNVLEEFEFNDNIESIKDTKTMIAMFTGYIALLANDIIRDKKDVNMILI